MWYTLEEMIGRESYDFRDDESWRTVQSNNDLRKQWEASKYEWVLKAKDGTLIPVLCSGTPIPGWGTVWIMTDLRELHSLKETQEQLKQANATKDEFISMISHELRTPLSSIRWYLSMILDGDMWDINIKIRKALNHSYNSSVRLINLVNDILSVGKIESWKMEYYIEHISVKEAIKSIYKDMYIEMENKWITFETNIAEDIENILVKADENKLKQILLNLLTNALKFTQRWWNITLDVNKKWKYLRFQVIDTWEWIKADKIDTLFDKFTQTESTMQRHNTSGIWLGLALVKNFLEAFWSDIQVESTYGEWSTFYFDLEMVY